MPTTLEDAVIRIRIDPSQARRELQKLRAEKERMEEEHKRSRGRLQHEAEEDDDAALERRISRITNKAALMHPRHGGGGALRTAAVVGGAARMAAAGNAGGALASLGRAGLIATAVAVGVEAAEAAYDKSTGMLGELHGMTEGTFLHDTVGSAQSDLEWLKQQVTHLWGWVAEFKGAAEKSKELGEATLRLGGQAPNASESWALGVKIHSMALAERELNEAIRRAVIKNNGEMGGRFINQTFRSIFR